MRMDYGRLRLKNREIQYNKHSNQLRSFIISYIDHEIISNWVRVDKLLKFNAAKPIQQITKNNFTSEYKTH